LPARTDQARPYEKRRQREGQRDTAEGGRAGAPRGAIVEKQNLVGVAGKKQEVEQDGEREGLAGGALDGRRQAEQGTEDGMADRGNADHGLHQRCNQSHEAVDGEEPRESQTGSAKDHSRGDEAAPTAPTRNITMFD